MNKALAFFLTLFGISSVPIALGFLLVTRGAAPRPWVAPWRVAYCCFALGALIALLAAGQETIQLFYFPFAHALLLVGVGLNTLGWWRLWRGSSPLYLAVLPIGFYGVFYFTCGRFWEPTRLAALFSILFALASAPAAVSAYWGLHSGHPHRRTAATLLLALNVLFWAVRGFYLLGPFSHTDHLYAFATAGLELTLYLGLQAFLQWSVLTE